MAGGLVGSQIPWEIRVVNFSGESPFFQVAGVTNLKLVVFVDIISLHIYINMYAS